MQICKTQALFLLITYFSSLGIKFKSRFQGKGIKIIGYGQYLLNYEMPINENASQLARQMLFCQSLEHHKIS